MIFQYRARNKKGEVFSGLVESSNLEEASDLLDDRGLTIIFLKEHEVTKLGQLKVFKKIKAKDLIIFFRQLAVMISSSFPIVQALRTTSKQLESLDLKIIISEVADEVEGGNRFSASLAKYPNVFTNFFVSMIKIGESSGKLDEILNYLADQQEKDYDLMSRIKGAMAYPIVILSVAVCLGIFMMVFIIPKLTEVLAETGTALPLPTRMLMGISDFFIHYGIFLLVVIILLVVFLKFSYLKNPKGRRRWDYLKMKIPIFGRFFQKIYVIRFTRSLNTLVVGGIPLTTGLAIVGEVIGNSIYQDLIKKTIKEVEDGNPISTVFMQSDIVPAMLSQMLDVGEQTGRLDEILGKLSNFYSRELDVLVNSLMTIIEPVILVGMGVGVGIMVAAFIMPMYNLANSM